MASAELDYTIEIPDQPCWSQSLLHGLLLAAFTIAGGWHLCWDRGATHTPARLGSTGANAAWLSPSMHHPKLRAPPRHS
ncbi:TMEM53 isoform 2 [Pongo abelii]|uniref:TMEM53 isoform 2 n=1 Tax=Pongo abelii TaxID=9601 RepID=A0A2J8SLZ1_PONAB|nr:TMEM53 isoform 2 [Pongo abelii]